MLNTSKPTLLMPRKICGNWTGDIVRQYSRLAGMQRIKLVFTRRHHADLIPREGGGGGGGSRTVA